MPGLLFPLMLLLPIAVIVAVVVASRHAEDDESPGEPGIGTVRRLFFYGLAFLGAMLAANGLAILIGGAAEIATGATLVRNESGLALGLSLTVVGTPTWLLFWALLQRAVRQHPGEQRATTRRWYLAVTRGVALVLLIGNAIGLIEWLLTLGSADTFEGRELGATLAWAGVWLFHERVAAEDRAAVGHRPFIDQLYLYFAALAGLAVLAQGAWQLMETALDAAYEALFLDSMVSGRTGVAFGYLDRGAAAGIAVGLATWWWHWLRSARHAAAATLWQAYVFLFGVFGGIAIAVTAAATMLHAVLQWMVGVPDEATASAHFDLLPEALSALLIGAGVWGYHRSVVSEELPADHLRSEPERVYRYLVAAAGLLTLAAGLVALLAMVIDVLTPEAGPTVRPEGWWRNQLVVGITLLVVGVPLWLRYWLDAQREAVRTGATERTSLSRRAFIFVVFGAAVLTTVVNLSILLFEFFDALLEGTLSAQVLHDTRWSIALLLVALVATVYHWLVLREDQAAAATLAPAAAAPEAARPREIVLISAAPAGPLARAIEGRTGARVRVWERLDILQVSPALSDQQIDALGARLLATASERVAVIVGGDGAVEVVPYSPSG